MQIQRSTPPRQSVRLRQVAHAQLGFRLARLNDLAPISAVYTGLAKSTFGAESRFFAPVGMGFPEIRKRVWRCDGAGSFSLLLKARTCGTFTYEAKLRIG